MPVVTDYTALLSGNYWNGIEVAGKPVIVTYSFPTTAPAYDAAVQGFTNATLASFQAFNTDEQAQARAALGEWAAASGIVFIEVAPGQGDINFQLVDLTTSGYGNPGGIAFYPFGDWDFSSYPSFRSGADASGDVFMNVTGVSGGTVNYGTLLHEIGHAIGLKHPTETLIDTAADPDQPHDQVLAADDPNLTVMATVGDGTPAGQVHLKPLDQNAAAFLYGASGGAVYTTSASGTNAVSAWTWNATTQTLNQIGTAGNDVIRGSTISDVIDGGGGDDRLFGIAGFGTDTLFGRSGNDYLDLGRGGVGAMNGGADNDVYFVASNDQRVIELADGGTDTIILAAVADYTMPANVETIVTYDNPHSITGNDLGNTIDGYGNAVSLSGGKGADYIYSTSTTTAINGDEGNDTLAGGGVLTGGVGDDVYYVDRPGQQAIESQNQGNDTVYASVSDSLSGQFIETLVLTGTATIDATGNGQANALYGNDGNNVLNGMGGIDTMTGGLGNDSYYVDNVEDKAIEAQNGGTDIVYASVSYGLAGQFIETLTLTGTANINATGNGQANALNGNAGDNVLNGMGGADTLAGGAGNDSYVVDTVGDKVIEAQNAGNDSVASSVSYSLAGQFIEALTLTGTADLAATGNGQNNLLTGNSGANTLNGMGGSDTMVGGGGNDIYSVDSYSTATGIFDIVVEAAGGGADTVYSAANGYVLADNVETLILVGAGLTNDGNAAANTIYADSLSGSRLNGVAGNDTLVGGGGNDTLDGGLDSDSLTGGLGDDTYYVDSPGDRVTELQNQGTDTIVSSIGYNLAGQFVETLTLTGTSGVSGTGNSQANAINGNGGANLLTGLDGADALNGMGGADTLVGGAGNDSLFVDNAGDVVTEDANGGTDTLFSSLLSVDLATFANIENLTLNGSNDLKQIGYGTSGNNVITGNIADNVIDGRGGADTMIGGRGNDAYYVDNAGDQVIETGGPNGIDGNDTVYASISYTLGDQSIETLALTGTENLAATGNSRGNLLIGNSGDNLLTGGSGAASADIFEFRAGFGHDTIADFLAGTSTYHGLIKFDAGTFASFADVMSHAAQVGANTVITYDAANAVTLQNVTLGSLVAADFLFG